jgi:serine/threonine protein kinase
VFIRSSLSQFFDTQAFVNFLGWFEDDDSVYIAMEYFQHGTLDEFIKQTLSEKDARIISLQLLEGLKIMHDEHFTHRDLKPQNIFVVQHSPNWWVKIGDFGISKRVANNETALQTNVGTPLYLAPEVFHYVPLSDEESDAYTNAVDVWSLACVVYTMLALRPPFVEWPRKLIIYCNGGEFPENPLRGRATSPAIDFIKSVLVPFPSERPTAEAALNSPWFQDDSLYEANSPTLQKGADEYQGALSLSTPQDTASGPSHAPNAPEDQSWDSETLAGSDGLRTITNVQASTNLHDTSTSYSMTAYRGGRSSMQLPDRSRPIPKTDESDPSRCINCHDVIVGEFHYCSVCNMSLCTMCLGYGNHCLHPDHWFMKRNRQKDGQIADNMTQTAATWFCWPKETESKTKAVAKPMDNSYWEYRMPRKAHKGRSYDYCFQCRTRFPADEPPHRHIWEQHDTVDLPVTQTEGFAKSRGTLPEPSTQTWLQEAKEEEQQLHDTKMKAMEKEMRVVFHEKVREKDTKLRQSEEELYMRHKELKESLNTRIDELREKRQRIEVGLPQQAPSQSFRKMFRLH